MLDFYHNCHYQSILVSEKSKLLKSWTKSFVKNVIHNHYFAYESLVLYITKGSIKNSIILHTIFGLTCLLKRVLFKSKIFWCSILFLRPSRITSCHNQLTSNFDYFGCLFSNHMCFNIDFFLGPDPYYQRVLQNLSKIRI